MLASLQVLLNGSRYLGDRLLFAGGLLAGAQLPVFINQYQQRVGGRLDQAQLDLQPFQAIADRLHGGSLEALVQHHLRSPDPTFYAEGEVIAAMMANVRQLESAYAGLDGSLWQQLQFLSSHYQADVAASTWSAFAPGMVVTSASITLALLVGFAASMAFRLCLFGAGTALQLQRKPATPSSVNTALDSSDEAMPARADADGSPPN